MPCSNLEFGSNYGRYKPGQVWLEKDLILPYVPNVDFCNSQCLHDVQSERKTLIFFRGRLKRNAVRFAFTFHKNNDLLD